jgi:riboflavin kinase/FMN adenylyltransferase
VLRIHSVDNLPPAVEHLRGCALTIGNFDGVHRGHQAILSRIRQAASKPGVPAVAVTFEPHPVQYFRANYGPFRLTTPAQKLHLLSHFGIDAPIIIRFDRSLSDLEPETFVRKVICEAFRPSLVVVGYDFNFGKNRRGTPELCQSLLATAGIGCEKQRAFEVDKEIVSSTRVRRVIAEGDLKSARRLLGRPYTIVGTVTHGVGRGRGLGFPTANVEPETERLPATGVYATLLETGSHLWQAISNIGFRPTFGGNGVTVETFVLDGGAPADLDLYGEPVAVHILERLRDEQKFPSPQALIEQIGRDVTRCRVILAAEEGADIIRLSAVTATPVESPLQEDE